MFNYTIKIRIADNCFKTHHIKEERYVNPLLNILKHYYREEDIIIEDFYKNTVTYKKYKTY